jgi:hypothetical protein
VPDEVFLKAVDIVLHHETEHVSLWNEGPQKQLKPQ